MPSVEIESTKASVNEIGTTCNFIEPMDGLTDAQKGEAKELLDFTNNARFKIMTTRCYDSNANNSLKGCVTNDTSCDSIDDRTRVGGCNYLKQKLPSEYAITEAKEVCHGGDAQAFLNQCMSGNGKPDSCGLDEKTYKNGCDKFLQFQCSKGVSSACK
jgi:hypothetical protein